MFSQKRDLMTRKGNRESVLPGQLLLAVDRNSIRSHWTTRRFVHIAKAEISQFTVNRLSSIFRQWIQLPRDESSLWIAPTDRRAVKERRLETRADTLEIAIERIPLILRSITVGRFDFWQNVRSNEIYVQYFFEILLILLTLPIFLNLINFSRFCQFC